MYNDIESGSFASSSQYQLMGISTRRVRNEFVKKVYSILSIQLLLTTLIASPFVLNKQAAQIWTYNNQWVVWLSLAISFTIMLTFACCPFLMRQFPTNYFLLFLFTVAEGVCVGIISSVYTTDSVLMALGTVTVVFFGLTLFALTTDLDFTKTWPYLFAITMVMIVAGFVLMFFPSHIGHMIYAGIGALLFSVYLIFDTQMIIGGKRDYEFSIDDYVPAAIALYIDIVQLFIYFLQLFGEQDRR